MIPRWQWNLHLSVFWKTSQLLVLCCWCLSYLWLTKHSVVSSSLIHADFINSLSHYEVKTLSCLSTVLCKYLLKISGLIFRLLLRSGHGCCTTPLQPWSHSTVLGDEPGRLKWTCLCCIINMQGLYATYRLVGYTIEFRLVWFISCLKFCPSFLCSSSCCLNIFILRNAINFLTSLARSACVILDYWIWPPLLLLDSPAQVLIIRCLTFLEFWIF